MTRSVFRNGNFIDELSVCNVKRCEDNVIEPNVDDTRMLCFVLNRVMFSYVTLLSFS